jgi:predicted acyltransferase
MRLKSLDVFRGVTVAGMLLVNLPGDRSNSFEWVRHAPWHGCTPADLVFPFFLFIVGITSQISLSSRRAQGIPDPALMRGILKRGAIIFGLGLFLNAFPFYPWHWIQEWRIPGVLQRIAVTYVLASFLFLKTNLRAQLAVSGAVLFGYWAAMSAYSLDEPAQTLSASIDRFFLEGHLWKNSKTWDPEGILSSFPATVTVMLGVWCGGWISRADVVLTKRLKAVVIAGVALVVAGLIWDVVFPINKALWTSSYVLFTGGLAALLLAFCSWLIDIKKVDRWSEPFLAFGMNPIAAYVGTSLMARIIYTVLKFDTDAGERSAQQIFYEATFARLWDPRVGSLLFSVFVVVVWYFILNEMRRRKVFLKV